MSDGGSSGNLEEDYVVTDKGTVESSSGNTIGADNPFATSSGSSGSFSFGNLDFGKAANALLSGSGGGMGAGMALGLGALAAALSRQQAPTIKAPEYKAAPVYNRALTSPLFPPQPAPQKSASGQNIYQPMKGMPLFFNPNPFQFDPTEAAKRYGPTPEQIAQGRAGYEAGLASLYKPMEITPFTYGNTSTVTGATGNDTVQGASGSNAVASTTAASPVQTSTVAPTTSQAAAPTSSGVDYKTAANQAAQTGFLDAVKAANPQLDWDGYDPNKMTMDVDPYQRAMNYYMQYGKGMPAAPNDSSDLINLIQGQSSTTPVTGKASGGPIDDIMVGYNDGGDIYEFAKGRYLSGGGDGMSDSIPATINNKQPARLADGEFVVPADVVSDLGNGSSNAGAKKLYAMMNKIRKARHGTSKQPPEVKADKAMPV